jgi:uncharacterized SAM-binding protein YcdF (DUF218 family)
MAFLLGKLVFLVLRPSNLFLIAALAGLAGVAWRRRWGMPLVAGGVIAIALCTVFPVGQWLTVPLEERFPAPANFPPEVDGIVVLGGGIDGRLTKMRGQPSFGETMERFASIPELVRRYPAAKIVFTGGVGWTGGDVEVSEARVIALFLAGQGVPEGRVALESEARSTRDNAVFALPLAQPKPGERWLLVTSAAHMPRSIGVFRRAGWPEMEAWPVDYRTSGTFELLGEPSMASRLDQLDQAAYEWYGLVYYWMLGYTDAIFPGPWPG